MLLWSAEQLLRPSYRNLTGSYESWAFRSGFLREIAFLDKKGLLERKSQTVDARVYRLTTTGRLHALGGRDPQLQWSRAWDGRWRLVLFDLPISHNTERVRLRRCLRDNGFGYLQNSVWITPDSLDEKTHLFRGAKIDVESLILWDARPCAGESDAEIVLGAWDFDRINEFYRQHLQILKEKPNRKGAADALALRRWATAEREAWSKAIKLDPLLPQRLLPSGYQGQRAWERRIEVLGKAKRDMYKIRPLKGASG